MDLRTVIWGGLYTYLASLGLLGIGTFVWGVTRWGSSGETLAAVWFALAGAGTLLTFAMLVTYSRIEVDDGM